MPNWCSNELTVSGTEQDVAAFVGKATTGSGSLSLECVRPTPDFEGADDDSSMPNWYRWRVANWGTKWDISDDDEPVIADESEGCRVWRFLSAWSPPVAAVGFAAAEHPRLRFDLKYDEPGNNFAGETVWAGGEVVEDWESESVSTVWCAVRGCDGYAGSCDPFSSDRENVVAFCEDHAFEEMVCCADDDAGEDS